MKSRTWITGAAVTGAVFALTAAVTVPALAGDVTPMIVGGSNATEAYPFSARLLTAFPTYGVTGRCTATLVTARGKTGVVVNAHCVTDPQTAAAVPATDITVQLGSTRLDRLVPVTPVRVTVQPGWDWGGGGGPVADVAVLELPPHIPGSFTGVQLGRNPAVGRAVRLLGWGKTTLDATEPPARLQQLDTRITTPAACAAAGIGVGEVCVAAAPSGAQVCSGDSGGPALGKAPGGWKVLGGASRETAADCTGPTVYTDYTYWSGWIVDALTGRKPTTARPPSGPAVPPPPVAPDAVRRFTAQFN